jgi:hypothetical protein
MVSSRRSGAGGAPRPAGDDDGGSGNTARPPQRVWNSSDPRANRDSRMGESAPRFHDGGMNGQGGGTGPTQRRTRLRRAAGVDLARMDPDRPGEGSRPLSVREADEHHGLGLRGSAPAWSGEPGASRRVLRQGEPAASGASGPAEPAPTPRLPLRSGSERRRERHSTRDDSCDPRLRRTRPLRRRRAARTGPVTDARTHHTLRQRPQRLDFIDPSFPHDYPPGSAGTCRYALWSSCPSSPAAVDGGAEVLRVLALTRTWPSGRAAAGKRAVRGRAAGVAERVRRAFSASFPVRWCSAERCVGVETPALIIVCENLSPRSCWRMEACASLSRRTRAAPVHRAVPRRRSRR